MKTQKTISPRLIPNFGTVLALALILAGYHIWTDPGDSSQAAPLIQESIPGVISYQGTLIDDANEPISDNIDMTFRFYNAPTGGTALWSEAHTGSNAVPVQNGLFHVLLGSLSPIPSTVWTNDTIYLSIQVDSESEMEPRERIGQVPYATRASVADQVTLTSTHQFMRDEITKIPANTFVTVGDSQLVVTRPGKIYAQCDVTLQTDPTPKRYVGLLVQAVNGTDTITLNDRSYQGTDSTRYTSWSASGILDLPEAGSWTIQCELHRSSGVDDPIVHTYSVTAFQIE